jgi:hypothetical protein
MKISLNERPSRGTANHINATACTERMQFIATIADRMILRLATPG